jgi:antitoxin VapB
MGLNIKKAETQRLARELAEATGESLTDAVTVAIRERLERIRRKEDKDDFVERWLEIGRDTAARLGSYRFIDHGEFLYDERGMPK